METCERRRLEELGSQVQCAKRMICINAAIDSAIDELCEVEYHEAIGVLECLESMSTDCRSRKLQGSLYVCTCPLRKYIVENFDRWSAASMLVMKGDLLRRDG